MATESDTAALLTGTRSVTYAAAAMRDALGTGGATLEYAREELERAADEQAEGTTRYRTLRFSELEAPQAVSDVDAEDDILVSVLADVEVAGVLVAAGRALGEEGVAPDPGELDLAITRLQATTTVLQSAEDTGKPARLGFRERGEQAVRAASPDLATAVQGFRTEASGTLEGLVTGAQGVAASVVAELRELPPAAVVKSLQRLGDRLEDAPQVGRLIRRGLERLRRAVASLLRLVQSEALEPVRARAQELWDRARADGVSTPLLRWAFQIGDAERVVEHAAGITNVDRAAVDAASVELSELAARFKGTLALLRKTVKAIAIAVSTALLLAPFLPPVAAYVPLAAAAAYALLLATLLLLGLDYADSGRWLGRVQGVSSVARRLAR